MRPVTLAAALLVMLCPAAATASYGGRPATPGEARSTARFTVQMGVATAECSGAVIAPRLVLTAAHCVRSQRRGVRVRVVGQELRTGNPGPRAGHTRITAVRVHPQFRSLDPRDGHDLAVLTLARAVGTPIPLITPEEEAAFARPPALVLATGFGVTRAAQTGPPRPARTVRLELLEPHNCVTPGLVDAFIRSQLCAAAAHQGVCPGDSGGPLTVTAPDGTPRLVGITTLALEERPCRAVVSMFARVAAMRTWVRSRINAAATVERPPGRTT